MTASEQDQYNRHKIGNMLIKRLIRSYGQDELLQQSVTFNGEQVPVYNLVRDLADATYNVPYSYPVYNEKGRKKDNDAAAQEAATKNAAAVAQATQRQQAILNALDAGPDEVKHKVIDIMAHAAQLQQMAGQLARESLINRSENADEFNPIRQMLFEDAQNGVRLKSGMGTVEEALKAIAKPQFEITFTAHPTNTNSLESMRKQRALAEAVVKVGQEGKNVSAETYNTCTHALDEFARTPLLPGMQKTGEPTPLTVGEETKTMLYFLGNVYEDLPKTYGAFDKELETAYGSKYAPEKLKLGLKFHSWGSSGDKDGNDNVNAETTLAALAMHKAEILKRYTDELAALDLPELKTAAERLNICARQAADIDAAIAKTREAHKKLTDEEFDRFSEQLKQTGDRVDLPGVMRLLEDSYSAAAPDKKQPVLDLLRRIQLFGNNFGQIEYRETAEEYTRVIEELVPDYARTMAPLNALKKDAADADKALRKAQEEEVRLQKEGAAQGQLLQAEEVSATLEKKAIRLAEQISILTKEIEPERQEILNKLLSDPAHRMALGEMGAALKTRLKDQAGEDYNPDNAKPITYQTLKRMELARDFPDAIQNNVLAECKNTSNVLEALVLQHAVAKDGKRAMMGIVPLFEEHETLAAAPEIVRAMLHNSAYITHVGEVAAAHGTPEAQQIQLAHSDNFKRAGVASRALLARAHEALREVIREFSAERERENKPILKIEFYEGGSQSDALRGGARATSAMVNAYSLHDFAKMTFQGGDLLNFFNMATSSVRLLTNNLANSIIGAAEEKRPRLGPAEEKVISAFDTAKSSYIDGLFNNKDFIEFLNRIDYGSSVFSGNFSSRKVARAGAKMLEKIDSVRAIGYSETMQHADFVATWVGVHNIEQHLEQELGIKEYGPCPPAKANTFRERYKAMPVYRDIIDKMAYGLMRTDLNYVAKTSAYADGTEHKLMDDFREQYVEAFRLCMYSYTGAHYVAFLRNAGLDKEKIEALQIRGNPEDPDMAQRHKKAVRELIDSGILRNIIKQEIFPHVTGVLNEQERQTAMAHHFETWATKPVTKEGKKIDISLREIIDNALIHNMKDTVHHGVIPEIIDTKFAKLYCDYNKIKRPWVMVGDDTGRNGRG